VSRYQLSFIVRESQLDHVCISMARELSITPKPTALPQSKTPAAIVNKWCEYPPYGEVALTVGTEEAMDAIP
jgi:hypothetical protein